MGGRNKCCCDCASPTLIANISFNGTNKVPANWNATSIANCCPWVKWTVPDYDGYVGILLFESINYNDTECISGLGNFYYCTRGFLRSIKFFFAKFTCNANWWVAMDAEIAVKQTRGVTAGVCGTTGGYTGTVHLFREKFVASIAPGQIITFNSTDHYDWTASGSCHERPNCPDEYTGEISTTSYYCCTTILDPNCTDSGLVNPVNVDFTGAEFSFGIS